jgi:hypothetical protein
MVNFYVFKWGTKYGPEYVNRLYGSLLKWCKVPFKFHCITDDETGLAHDIEKIYYAPFGKLFDDTGIFTVQKLLAMHMYTDEHNVILDLDILIHNDITDLVTTKYEKPTFIWCSWHPIQDIHTFARWHRCLINSSMVVWNGNNAAYLYEYLKQNQKLASYTYDSCDMFLFCQMYLKDPTCFNYFDESRFYNYNVPNLYAKQAYEKTMCLFNTSHRKQSDYRELHEADGWVKEIWEGYDAFV